jgi:hypothetical protein
MKLNKQFTATAISLTVSNLAKEMMNYKKSLAFIGLITSSALTLSSNPAQAFSFNPASTGTSANLGTCSSLGGSFKGLSDSKMPTCKTADGFTLEAAPIGKNLQGKQVGGIVGVGVSDKVKKPTYVADPVHGEIDYGESIKLTLPNPKDVLKNIGLSFLYQPGVFGDKVFEQAKIVTDTGLTGYLKVTGNTSATWSFAGGGAVTNLSPSTGHGGGYYNIDNPFGNEQFTFLTLTPVTYVTDFYGKSIEALSTNSDFALAHATAVTKAVPEPTAIAGLGLVGGLLLATRRRKAIQS